MKSCRLIPLLFFITVVFVIAGCTNQKDTSIICKLIPADDIKRVAVGYVHASTVKEWELEQDKLGDWKAWVKALSLEHEAFEEGNSPGDNDGGSVYNFTVNNGESAFSYVMSGENRYIVFNDEWYKVSNPSDPLVGNSTK